MIDKWGDLVRSSLRVFQDDVAPGAVYRFLCKGPGDGIVHVMNTGIPHSVYFPGHAYQAPRDAEVHETLGSLKTTRIEAGGWVIVAQWRRGIDSGTPALYLASYFGLNMSPDPKHVCVTETGFRELRILS